MSEVTRRSVPPAQRWSLPTIEGEILGTRQQSPQDANARAKMAAAELAIARATAQAAAEKAQTEARERGYTDGLIAADKEMRPKIQKLDQQLKLLQTMLDSLARPLADLDEQIPQQLARLATAVGRQLARRELSADPGQIIAIIREAVSRLPAAARDVRVHVNPNDAAVVRERLASPSQERAWVMVEDPTLTQGGCLVRSDTSQIDARLESRLNAIAAELFGESRTRDRNNAPETAAATASEVTPADTAAGDDPSMEYRA